MPEFVFTYRTPVAYDPTPETGARWMAWFDAVGEDVVALGKPVVDGSSVGTCDPERTRLGGYSVIRADDLDAALVVAKGCPVLAHDGGIEIGQLGEIPEPLRPA